MMGSAEQKKNCLILFQVPLHMLFLLAILSRKSAYSLSYERLHRFLIFLEFSLADRICILKWTSYLSFQYTALKFPCTQNTVAPLFNCTWILVKVVAYRSRCDKLYHMYWFSSGADYRKVSANWSSWTSCAQLLQLSKLAPVWFHV